MNASFEDIEVLLEVITEKLFNHAQEIFTIHIISRFISFWLQSQTFLQYPGREKEIKVLQFGAIQIKSRMPEESKMLLKVKCASDITFHC